MDYKREIKNQLIEIAMDFHNKNWFPASSGSLSFRISKSKMLVTPAGVSKGSLLPSSFIKASIYKNKFNHGYLEPPLETKVHSWIYQNFLEVNCIMHSYSVAAIFWKQKNPKKESKWSGYEIQRFIHNIDSYRRTFKLIIIDNAQDFDQLVKVLEEKKDLIANNYAFLVTGKGEGRGLYCFSQYSNQCRLQLEAIEYLLASD